MHFLDFAKYLILTVLASFDTTAYVGMTAIDASARAVHAATYVTLSRAGLQLPVGAFVQPPKPFTSGDVMLYVVPGAVASWSHAVDALYHHVPQALSLGYRAATYAAATLAAHHERLAPTLSLIPPPFLTTSQSAYTSVRWSRDESTSLALHTTAYTHPSQLASNVSSSYLHLVQCSVPALRLSPALVDDAGLGLSLTDRRSPYSAVVGLEQCTPYRVLPAREYITTWSTSWGASTALILYERHGPNKLEESKEVAIYKFPSFYRGYWRTNAIITIHVRACLIALVALCCTLFVGYVVLRLILRDVRWICVRIFGLLAFVCGSVASSLKFAANSAMGICGYFMLLVAPMRARPDSSSSDPTPDSITPPLPLLSTSPDTVSATTSDSVPPPPASPSSSPKSAKKKKKGKKKAKNKAKAGPSTAVDPANIPLPADSDESWTVPPSPPFSPLPDVETLTLPSTPPLDSSSDLILEDDEGQVPLSLSVPLPAPAPSSPSYLEPSSVPLLDISPAEEVQDGGEPASVPSTMPIVSSPPLAPAPQLADTPSPTHVESDQDDGSDWTMVERKCKPRRAPNPTPQRSSSSKLQDGRVTIIGKGRSKGRKKA